MNICILIAFNFHGHSYYVCQSVPGEKTVHNLDKPENFQLRFCYYNT